MCALQQSTLFHSPSRHIWEDHQAQRANAVAYRTGRPGHLTDLPQDMSICSLLCKAKQQCHYWMYVLRYKYLGKYRAVGRMNKHNHHSTACATLRFLCHSGGLLPLYTVCQPRVYGLQYIQFLHIRRHILL